MNLSALDKLRRVLGCLARDRSGAGALEFALVAPALIFLIMATIQISLALYKGSTVQWASERVVRMAMVDEDISAATLQAQLQADLAEMGDDFQVEVSYQVDTTGDLPIARMQVHYSYPIILPMVEAFRAQFTVDSSVPLLE